MKRLAGKVILVTGAARGLGRAFAERCAQEGAALALIDVLADAGEETARGLAAQGTDVIFRRCDITRTDELDALRDEIQARWGRLDGLVNNAALATGLAGKTFDQIEEANWDRVFQVNVKGTWLVTKAVLPLLKAAGEGRIVNLASDTAIWGADLFMHYVASKGAIIAMTRAMARELAPFQITVNAIAPGLTTTEATELAPPRRWQQYLDNQLVKRSPEPEDIVGAAAMLLSADSSFITGQTIIINGGMTLS
ncbi:SDR family NAD(P)-dependent oxidoreductase [Lacisediminimonas profundi]|uniref:SDR family NAD(P)-dependent oxidoreductase n=1 Tax=Lacisediminimonas profundi TaxID=2603856 RepID=UPI0018836573|nr:SDR family oxidoreductase [Lacisediminimonas profundi]